MKNVTTLYNPPAMHWVGDGFPVRSLFSYHRHAQTMSPFLLLDRAGPYEFEPARKPRGVGPHPHRGFETVTLVYQGEVAHRDSAGNSGVIGPGDVQWMTAGAGVLHEEFHSQPFTERGGVLDMVQLWVNLPAKHKMTAPRYQAISQAEIPLMASEDGLAQVRVIAGQHGAIQGPAQVFSPMNVWDAQLQPHAQLELPAVEGWNTAVIVLHGTVHIGDQMSAKAAQMAQLEVKGEHITLKTDDEPAAVLLLSGQNLAEPVVGRGPFVMNTAAEIAEAMQDFSRGKWGVM
jgi:quercetin 2,3-dioxygenase